MSRYLTVLLTDIAGFTDRTRSLSREGLLELLEGHRAAVLPHVEARRGRVVKEIGDAFLVVFESPTDACLAASDIRAATEKLRFDGQPLRLRLAAAAGDIDEIAGDVFGDAVNLASRLEKITPMGRIWATGTVVHGVKKSEIELLRIGTRQFKGFENDPIPVWEVFPPEKGGYRLSTSGRITGPHSREETEKLLHGRPRPSLWDEALPGWTITHPHFPDAPAVAEAAPKPSPAPAVLAPPAAGRTDPAAVQNLYQQARSRFEAGDLTGARSLCLEAVKIDPKFARGHNLFGAIAMKNGDLASAADAFALACSCEPDLLEAAMNHGHALRRLNRIPDAIAAFERACRLAPKQEQPHMFLGEMLVKARRLPQAAQVWSRVLDINPGNREIREKLENLKKAF